MTELFAALLETLREQLRAVDRMLEAGKSQCGALKKADVTKINKAVQDLKRESSRLALLENKRLEIQLQMEGELDLPAGVALSDLLRHGPEEVSKNLQELLQAFQSKMTEMQFLNETNRLLARNGLRFNEYLLRALRRPVNNFTYQGSGQVKGQSSLSLLNRTV